MNNVYIFLAEGFEEIEGLTVVDLLRRAEIEIRMVSMTGTLHVTGAHGIGVKADLNFEDLNFEDAKMLVLPGGMPGTHHLETNQALLDLVVRKEREGVLIGAICAAPRILGTLGLLKNKRAVCYPGNEEKLLGAIVTASEVEKDGTIITSRGMGTAILFGLALITSIKGEKEAEKIRASILYHTDRDRGGL